MVDVLVDVTVQKERCVYATARADSENIWLLYSKEESKQSHVETNDHALKLEIKTFIFLSLE